MRPYSECDESPVVTECGDCGEIFAEDDCPYCEDAPPSIQAACEIIRKQAVEIRRLNELVHLWSKDHAAGVLWRRRLEARLADAELDARDRRRDRAVGSKPWHIGDVT